MLLISLEPIKGAVLAVPALEAEFMKQLPGAECRVRRLGGGVRGGIGEEQRDNEEHGPGTDS